MHFDGRINQVAAQRSQPRKRAVFIGAGETAETHHVGGEDCGQFAGLGHMLGNPGLERESENYS